MVARAEPVQPRVTLRTRDRAKGRGRAKGRDRVKCCERLQALALREVEKKGV